PDHAHGQGDVRVTLGRGFKGTDEAHGSLSCLSGLAAFGTLWLAVGWRLSIKVILTLRISYQFFTVLEEGGFL
ncbi:hypothetical protein ACQP3L_39310, partial [Escherichia coli]